MGSIMRATLAAGLLLIAAPAAAATPYPAMAPLAQYRMESQADEIAMARSAAPPALAKDAEVLVLGDHGYETAAKGANGFVCLVQRSWADDFGDAEFWNPKVRSPICMNAAAVRSVLPDYLRRTEWSLAGLSEPQMVERAKAAPQPAPEAGAMGYMMSRQGYLADATSHWRPHLMIFLPHTPAAAWGANLPGAPVMGGDGDPVTVFFVPVTKWSDETAPAMEMK